MAVTTTTFTASKQDSLVPQARAGWTRRYGSFSLVAVPQVYLRIFASDEDSDEADKICIDHDEEEEDDNEGDDKEEGNDCQDIKMDNWQEGKVDDHQEGSNEDHQEGSNKYHQEGSNKDHQEGRGEDHQEGRG